MTRTSTGANSFDVRVIAVLVSLTLGASAAALAEMGQVYDLIIGLGVAAATGLILYATFALNRNALYAALYPFKVLFWEYTFLFRDFAHAPSWKDKVVVLFGRPGETFEVPAVGGAAAAPVVIPAAVAA
jgi:hypothetical protein